MKNILFFLFFTNFAFSQTYLSDTDKLSSWTKAWGFLKYFHPTVTHGDIDWDQVYITQLDSIKKIDTKEELNSYFLEIVNDLNNQTTLEINKLDEDFIDEIIRNFIDKNDFTEELIMEFRNILYHRISGESRFLRFDKIYGYPLFIEDTNIESNFPSTEYRLLALARIWNVVNYFYPYKDETLTSDWNIVLKNQIPVFEKANDSLSYFQVLTSTIYELHDSHSALLNHKNNYHPYGNKVFPYSFMFVDEKLFLKSRFKLPTDIIYNGDEIRYDDIIQSIDGKSISKFFNEYSKYISASHKESRNKFIAFEMRRGWNEVTEVVVLRNNNLKTLRIPRVQDSITLKLIDSRFDQFNNWTLIDNEIGFIQPRDMTSKEFKKAFKRLRKSKALIIDLRNGVNNELNPRLMDDLFSIERKKFFMHKELSRSIPGKFIENFESSYTGKNQKQKFKGKLILLINDNLQSAGETRVAIFKSYPNVTLIGYPTSGTNGLGTYIDIPGGYQFFMTSTIVKYLDGTNSVGPGIQPNVFVRPTVNGLIKNRDEVLEQAIEYGKRERTNYRVD